MVKDEFLERKFSSCPNWNHYFILYQNTGAPFRYSFYSQLKLSRVCASLFLTQRMIKGCNGDQQGWSRDRAKGEGLERERPIIYDYWKEKGVYVCEKKMTVGGLPGRWPLARWCRGRHARFLWREDGEEGNPLSFMVMGAQRSPVICSGLMQSPMMRHFLQTMACL